MPVQEQVSVSYEVIWPSLLYTKLFTCTLTRLLERCMFAICKLQEHTTVHSSNQRKVTSQSKSTAIPLHSMMAFEGGGSTAPSFLTSALDDGSVLSITPRPPFTPGERAPGTHCIGGWVGPRAGLGAEVV
jgi:hypothetical protein